MPLSKLFNATKKQTETHHCHQWQGAQSVALIRSMSKLLHSQCFFMFTAVLPICVLQ